MVTEQQINAFSLFAKSRIEGGATAQSLVELLDEWMIENPSNDDRLAIQASLRDMDEGETASRMTLSPTRQGSKSKHFSRFVNGIESLELS
jgi:hypothetical protein